MQFCPKFNTACKLLSCKFGEEFLNFEFHADDHELQPYFNIATGEIERGEMSEEQFERWKKGERFFEPRKPRWEVTTDKGVYVGKGNTGKIIEECEDFEAK